MAASKKYTWDAFVDADVTKHHRLVILPCLMSARPMENRCVVFVILSGQFIADLTELGLWPIPEEWGNEQ